MLDLNLKPDDRLWNQVDASLFAKLLNDEQRRVIVDSSAGEIFPRVILVLIMAYMAGRAGRPDVAAIWAAIMILIPGPTLYPPFWVRVPSDSNLFPRSILLNAVVFPLGWCALPLLVPEASVDVQLIILFVLCLISVARVRVSAYHPPEMYTLIPVMFCALAVTQVLRGGAHRGVMVGILGILSLGLVAYGRSNYQRFLHFIAINVRNEQLVEQLRLANAAKTRFLASASHDLRQPLHSAGLLVGMLSARIRDASLHTVVERLTGAIGSMENLLNAILDISRLDAGVEHPSLAPVSLQRVFDRLAQSFGEESAQRRLTLRFRSSQLWVLTDEHLLLRILSNLIGNGLRYTPAGGVLVGARRRGGDVVIEVWDTGIGIPVDQHGEVFKEFVQLQNPHRDRSQGLGLGLSIVQRTAAILGHAIQLRSRVGQGTMIRLTLPLVNVPKLPPSQQADVETKFDNLYVLLVDDEQDVRYAMHGLLSDWGCTVVAAGDGSEAMTEIRNRLRTPDALILDYRLPKETGVVLADQLQDVIGSTLPTLIVTGDVTPGPLQEIEKSGLPVLHKPVNPANLRHWLTGVQRSLMSGRSPA